MNARIWMAASVVALVTACSHIEPAQEMAGARYGHVVSTQALDGSKQRIVVRMPDGSTIDVTQERDSGILEGDVVRILGTGSETRVRRL